MADEDRKAMGDMWTHQPLPYVVRLRITADEDSAPRVQEFKVTAYSIIEAMMQANFLAGGSGIDGEKYKVEEITPDMPAYLAMFVANQALAAKVRR
jgi:hypothetical protein